jgi:malate dehydrogenase
MDRKITIVGAGNVGSTTAQLIAEKGLADVVLVDIVEGLPQGKALDIQEACPLWNSPVSVKGSNSFEDARGSDIVVITAGLARKPGMSRDDLLQANAEIVKGISREVARTSPDAIVIVVTNPMDAMAYLSHRVTGFHHRRVIGMGGVLDSTRMRSFIAKELGVHPRDVQTLVLGGHGDQMVPLPRLTMIDGKCITDILPEERVEAIVERTRNGGAEIVGLLKTGSAYYAPAASIVEMVEAVFGIKDEILPCSVYLDGEYGIRGVYLGVPVRLSREGVREIVEIKLTREEEGLLRASAEAVRSLITKIEV